MENETKTNKSYIKIDIRVFYFILGLVAEGIVIRVLIYFNWLQ